MGTPKYPRKAIAIEPTLWENIVRISVELGIPINAVVEQALLNYVDEQKFK